MRDVPKQSRKSGGLRLVLLFLNVLRVTLPAGISTPLPILSPFGLDQVGRGPRSFGHGRAVYLVVSSCEHARRKGLIKQRRTADLIVGGNLMSSLREKGHKKRFV